MANIILEPNTKFISPATIILSGATSSGKTCWIERFLRENLFDKTPKTIYYCYGVYQPRFEHLASTINLPLSKNCTKHESDSGNNINTVVELIQGLPEQFDKFGDGVNHNVIIIDDLQDEVSNSKEVEKLFTRESHHKNLSVVYINQNIFYCGKNSRTIALNTHYTVLFRNPRAASQLRILRSQTGIKYLEDAYEDALKAQNFGYLVLDLSPYSKSRFKLRTKIFSNEDLIVYE